MYICTYIKFAWDYWSTLKKYYFSLSEFLFKSQCIFVIICEIYLKIAMVYYLIVYNFIQ